MKLSLGDLARLVLPGLVLWDYSAVEDLPVHGGEDDIEDEGNKADGEECIGKAIRSKDHSKYPTTQATSQFYRCSESDHTGESVLCADHLRPASLLLTCTKETDQPAYEHGDQEWERQHGQLLDCPRDAGCFLSIE